MDLHHSRVPNSRMMERKKGNKGKRNDENSLKVVYISTPMKVRTSTARFRALVQQLTGKNSDIAGYMDTCGASATEFHDDCEFLLANKASGHRLLSSISSDDTNMSSTSTTIMTTPTTSDSFMEDQFARVYSSEYSCSDPSQLDVLGSYEDLII